MAETLVILLAFIYVLTWSAAYARGYDNGVRDAEQARLERAQRMIDSIKSLPPEQSPR